MWKKWYLLLLLPHGDGNIHRPQYQHFHFLSNFNQRGLYVGRVFYNIFFLCELVYMMCAMCICIGNRERESERAVFGLNFDSFFHFFRKILYFFSHCLFLGLTEHFSLFQHPTFFCSVLPHFLLVRSQCSRSHSHSHSHSNEIRLSRNEMLICNHQQYLSLSLSVPLFLFRTHYIISRTCVFLTFFRFQQKQSSSTTQWNNMVQHQQIALTKQIIRLIRFDGVVNVVRIYFAYTFSLAISPSDFQHRKCVVLAASIFSFDSDFRLQ